MSPIPPLPTDNLYKFCAVAGGVAIIFSLFVFFQAWRDVRQQRYSTHGMAVEQEYKEMIVGLRDQFSKPEWQPDGGKSPEALAAEKELQEKAQRIKPTLEESRKKLVADQKRLDLAIYDLEIVGVATGVLLIFGCGLGFYGFKNWLKLQLKQDQLLDLELRRQEKSE